MMFNFHLHQVHRHHGAFEDERRQQEPEQARVRVSPLQVRERGRPAGRGGSDLSGSG